MNNRRKLVASVLGLALMAPAVLNGGAVQSPQQASYAAAGGKEAVIARDHRSRYVIAMPDSPSPAVKYAASELQTFIRQLSAVELPILAEKDAGSKPVF